MNYKNHSKRIQSKLAQSFPKTTSAVMFNGEIVVVADNFSDVLKFVKNHNKKTRSCWLNLVITCGCHAVKLVPRMVPIRKDDNVIIYLNEDPYINF